MNLRMEKEHSDKLQDLLRRDKEVLELECEKLRKELLSVNATVGGSACMHVCMYNKRASCSDACDVVL